MLGAVEKFRERRQIRLDGVLPRDDGAPKGNDNAAKDHVMKSEAKVECSGSADSKRFIKDYFAKHPEVAEEAKQYRDVLSNVVNFAKNNPGASDGTYDAVTQQEIPSDKLSGYCVTFHQNQTEDNPYGDYDSETYAAMCAITKRELGADSVNIGYFGNPEVSFVCKDRAVAKRFAVAHNQNSIYDPAKDKVIKNMYYDKKKNPIKGVD